MNLPDKAMAIMQTAKGVFFYHKTNNYIRESKYPVTAIDAKDILSASSTHESRVDRALSSCAEQMQF